MSSFIEQTQTFNFFPKNEYNMKRILFSIFLLTAIVSQVAAQSDTLLIKKHLTKITKTDGFRNHNNVKVLDQVAGYIYSVFDQYADTTYYQPYMVDGKTYRNVVCRFGSKINKPIMVVGAHYDVCGNQEGADDNASGVTAILELARMMKGKTLDRPLEIVAYTLEEPPYFRTPYMGSNIHAQSLKQSNTPVYGMVAIEMIGFFSDTKGSQQYPVKVMKVAYGTKGDYILLLKKNGYGEFVKNFSKQFNNAKTIETSNLKAPSKIQGVDFSDHLNYWNAGYDAMMVTNTAFYRNKNYHQTTDTMETLDIPRMANVIDGIYYAITNIDKQDANTNKKSSGKVGKRITKKY